MTTQPLRWHGLRAITPLLALLIPSLADAAPEAQTMNPIGRVARIFNRKLVEVEDRIEAQQGKLDRLAVYGEKPLKQQLGWRCGSTDDRSGEPWVALDLHREAPLGEIYLVPAQRQPGDPLDFFPRRFTIEAALRADFSDARQIYTTGETSQPPSTGCPVRIPGDGAPARHVRVKFLEGYDRGLKKVCALSEIFVFSGETPVSFGATVSAGESIDIPGMWEAPFLVDGRTPLGLWEGGMWSASRGDCLDVTPAEPVVEWIVPLLEEAIVDRVVLYPYSLPELSGPGVIPPRLTIEAATSPDLSDAVKVAAVTDLPVDLTTPVVIPLAPSKARYLRIVSTKPWQLGTRYLQALGELEAWKGSDKLTAGQAVMVRNGGLEHTTNELTDGSSNGLQILPIRTWLSQLVERAAIEREMASLRPQRASMASESELNTTWGAAIALGLTFLIPVAIVERRRLISTTQLDLLRKRIATDLHDDIGSNLGSISLIARSAKRDLERLHGPDEVAHDLGEVETIARESSLAMRDIVWLLERRQDTLGDFVQRMRDTAARLLRDIDYSVVCRSTKATAKLTLDSKRHLFLFYKEALHNILKHSKAKEVTVRLYDSRDRLVLEIADNGVGLPRDAEGKPRGLAKISDRARVLDGSLHVESAPGEGTTLRLSVKRINLVASKVTIHE